MIVPAQRDEDSLVIARLRSAQTFSLWSSPARLRLARSALASCPRWVPSAPATARSASETRSGVRIRMVVTAGACTGGPIGWRIRLLMPSPLLLVGWEPLVPHPSGPACGPGVSALDQLADGHRRGPRPPQPRWDLQASAQPAVELAQAVTQRRPDPSHQERPACGRRRAPSAEVTHSLTRQPDSPISSWFT